MVNHGINLITESHRDRFIWVGNWNVDYILYNEKENILKQFFYLE